MGTFFNPGNGSFTQDKNSEIYIDKTELPFVIIIDEWDCVI